MSDQKKEPETKEAEPVNLEEAYVKAIIYGQQLVEKALGLEVKR